GRSYMSGHLMVGILQRLPVASTPRRFASARGMRRGRMRRPFSARSAAAMLVTGMAAAIIGTAAPAWAGRTTHTVRPGESIQAAIAASQPGDKIKIMAGTYH